MGERDWYVRYWHARLYADEQAALYEQGEVISNWRYKWLHKPGEPMPATETLEGPAWIAWAYEIAASDARTLMQVQGKQWQPLVDECEQLAEHYRKLAAS
jgi:hypothetical protein